MDPKTKEQIRLYLDHKSVEYTEYHMILQLHSAYKVLSTLFSEAHKHLQWIAQQHCTMDAEGASEDTLCSETGACITEFCLPCYAETVLRTERQKHWRWEMAHALE